VIHRPGKVHEKEKGDVDRYTEPAVGKATVREANASRLDQLSRRDLMRMHARPAASDRFYIVFISSPSGI
jgi:hypothetical protein